MKSRGEKLARGIGLELENQPLVLSRNRHCKSLGVLGNFQLRRLLPSARGSDQTLRLDPHRLHVLVEQRYAELSVFFGDLAVHGFIVAEFDDAALIRPEFNPFMPERKAGT
ncbi:MAG: hypothetical protein EAZ84_01280 [Verrucomicrobia bacterium]|nr:MAG: hypothetical protein EAZ84_01280 [Verrucomicrobiota bacterium]TAE87821.1 MAG: hypothetical protein EAZ82_06290 [Verrucomicrobiota bacterium]